MKIIDFMKVRRTLIFFLSFSFILWVAIVQTAWSKGSLDGGDFITKQDMRDMIINFLVEETNIPYEGIKLGDFRFRDFRSPAQPYEVQISLRRGRIQRGKASLAIKIVGEGIKKRMFITAPILVQKKVLSLLTPKNKGEILQKSDLIAEKKWVPYPSDNLVPGLDLAIGKEMKRVMRDAGILTTDYIDIFPVVRTGDAVLIVAEVSGVKVVAKGVARGRGKAGEVIRVANSISGKVISARVLDEKSVLVEL